MRLFCQVFAVVSAVFTLYFFVFAMGNPVLDARATAEPAPVSIILMVLIYLVAATAVAIRAAFFGDKA